MTTVPRIALQIDTATGYSSALIHGIVEHTREHRRWELLVQTRGSRERWRIPAHWRPDGVIARVTRRSQARELVRLGVPVVNVSRSAVPGFPFPQVTVDERAIGTWAADHLVERGFTHVAYVGLTSQAFYTDTCGPAAGRSRPELVAPLRIIQRRSTDTVACADQDVVAALRLIRDRAHTPLDVGDVLRHVPISRRALEQRFRRLLGRTPAAEIRRLRLERARELLRGTDWPMPRIAAAAGFSGAVVMNQVFRRDLGRTPSAERRRARSGAVRAGGA